MVNMKKIFLFATVLLIAAGCSNSNHRTNIDSNMQIDGAPDWVNKGAYTVNDQDGRFIYGVGLAPVMGDVSLQKSTADNRARAEIAKVLVTFVDSTFNSYTTSNGEKADLSTNEVLQSSTKTALAGTTIIAHWKNPETGEIYSFAQLDLKNLTNAINNATTISESFKEYSNKNLISNFDRFTQENK